MRDLNNQFREAFGSIHATEQMKQNTCDFLLHEYSKQQRKHRIPLRYATVFCAILALVICSVSGYRFYITPVSYISVDVNPSVELGLNRLDYVVSSTAYNNDGVIILQNLNLKHKSYTEAIEILLADNTFGNYLSDSSLLSFTVVSDKEEVLLAGIRQCHGYANINTECHSANAQLVEDAHHTGLSFGKYQAFLELSNYDKSITAEDCRNLTMRQIRDRIRQYQMDSDNPAPGRQSNGHHGCGNHS